jgi:hypothetical protein
VGTERCVRLRRVVAGTLAALSALVPLDGAAAAGQCSIVTPTKVVIDEPYLEVPLRLATNCAAAGREYAEWSVVHPSKGMTDILAFDSFTVENWDLYGWPAHYAVQPTLAGDFNDVALTQNTAHISAKLGSRLTATSTRSNGRLTFSASARTYSPTFADWYKRAGANVSLMHRAPGSSTWTWVTFATTDSSGRVSLSVVPAYGFYRLMIKETATVWASYSPEVRGK